ncbi:Glycosyltransferase, GT2 family [Paucidesulfovibrio gracilis DSM 16080]|uniref:Glycosyltransferase, GT2 family n=1 Tax=Paucidesulfovibrio gracilis DSM 16080 TaxID=1121449 RepID=A0A1T4WBB1_9BACT|nr:glycosyltransferase [Paucidesulfovibrio gracilis]SKA74586.1 Glycosyltransferase, GT2 family [Paucidesulfovibrio gracilis DSM 16080]
MVAMFSSHDPAFGQDALRLLRSAAPTWPLGIEEDRTALSLGSGMARMARDNAPALWDPARRLLFWNWQRRPLHRDALDDLLQAGGDGSLPMPRLLRRLQTALHRPLDPAPLLEAMELGEQALVLKHLLRFVRCPGDGLFWLAQCWDWLLRLGREDLPPSLLDAVAVEEDSAPVLQGLRAQWAVLYRPAEEALAHVQKMDPALWSPWREYLEAELYSRLGRQVEAVRTLGRVWRAMPWHPNIILKLSGWVQPVENPEPADLVDACVLVYSWNKADLLEQTLRSVAASQLQGARVVVLDNGSNDRTPEVVARCSALFPPGRFTDVRLPVNVGAPAARNWMLSLPEVRESRMAAFLDDDVILPSDWLVRLTAAMERHDADVVGCRIVSASPPPAVQSADYHLLEPGRGGRTFQECEDNVVVFENSGNALDFGLYDYCRPAVSVSGCCHLLRLRGVEQVGDFDIRFSPTQFDDLERDLRVNLAGLRVVYDGGLVVRHVQHSSLAKAQSLSSAAHIFGNRMKLEGKYRRAEIMELAQKHTALLWDDLLARRAALVRGLP